MKYFWLTLKHKWFVFCAGIKIKVPIWRLLIHDWSKFLPSELPHYNRQFFGNADDPEGFISCWVKHQNRNPHHWEYWIPRTGHNRCSVPYPDNQPIVMPEVAVREMVADWLGAEKAYNGKYPDVNNWTWLKDNRKRIRLHPETQNILNRIIIELKYKK